MYKRHFLHALKNITNYKLRSFLTLLGIWIGTTSIVALLTGTELAGQSAVSEFKKLGVDLIGLSISNTNNSNKAGESFSLLDFKEILKDKVEKMVPYTLHYSSLAYNYFHTDTSIIGADENLFSILKYQLLSGRSVLYLDKTAFYCVLGHHLAEQLSPNPKSLVGEQVKINQFYFTVIGVLAEADKNLFLIADSNDSVIIPLGASLLMYKDAHISNMLFKIKADQNVSKFQNLLKTIILSQNPNTELTLRSPEALIANMKNQQRTFNLLLGFIGSIALLVGGIGVMNIMLVSVTERRREIGIRMAVGAGKTDILYLFLSEAVILTFLGGLVGIFSGEIISYIITKISHWEYHLLFSPIAIGFFVSILVGILSGIYPAKKAASLDPIEALRMS